MLNHQQRKFAQGVAKGERPASVYAAVYGTTNDKSNSAAASRLLKDVKVQNEISRIQSVAELLADGAVFTVMEKRRLLRAMALTPLSELTTDHIFAQEVTISKPYKAEKTKDGAEQMELWVTEKIKRPDIVRAIELDCKLDGSLKSDQVDEKGVDALGALLGEIRNQRNERVAS